LYIQLPVGTKSPEEYSDVAATGGTGSEWAPENRVAERAMIGSEKRLGFIAETIP
jgi:hypothetical protein